MVVCARVPIPWFGKRRFVSEKAGEAAFSSLPEEGLLKLRKRMSGNDTSPRARGDFACLLSCYLVLHPVFSKGRKAVRGGAVLLVFAGPSEIGVRRVKWRLEEPVVRRSSVPLLAASRFRNAAPNIVRDGETTRMRLDRFADCPSVNEKRKRGIHSRCSFKRC